MTSSFSSYFDHLKSQLKDMLELIEGKAKFEEKTWPEATGYNTRCFLLENGQVIEKGGMILFEKTHALSAAEAEQFGAAAGQPLQKTGLHVVMHPQNPTAPVIHACWSYTEIRDSGGKTTTWIEAETGLIPFYLIDQDAVYFHRVCKEVCDVLDPGLYTRAKATYEQDYRDTDRQETIGVGGIRLTRQNTAALSAAEKQLELTRKLGDAFIPAYLPILEKRKDTPCITAHLEWQNTRRQQLYKFYNQFKFQEKETLNALIKKIYLPPINPGLTTSYNIQTGSREAQLIQTLKNPREWI